MSVTIKTIICAVWQNFAIDPQYEQLVRKAESSSYIEKREYYCGSLLMQLTYEVTDKGMDFANLGKELRHE